MKCPNCNTRLMPADRGSVAIDFCPKCWGVWLDRGELDTIIRASRASAPVEGSAIPPMSGTRVVRVSPQTN